MIASLFLFAAFVPMSEFGPLDNKEDLFREISGFDFSIARQALDGGCNMIMGHRGDYSAAIDRATDELFANRYNHVLDVCEEYGAGLIFRMCFGQYIPRVKAYPLLTAHGRSAYGASDPSLPGFKEKVGIGARRQFERIPDSPAFYGIRPASEVRDRMEPADTEVMRERYRAYSGREIPPGCTERMPQNHSRISDFPIGRVIPHDYPIYDFYRWWWKRGDGWNEYNEQVARIVEERYGRTMLTEYDPSTRVPPFRGAGGGAVTMLGQWTYPARPQPFNVAFATAEQQAMARSYPGQGVFVSIQCISYRTEIAPAGKTPANPPKWYAEFPNTKYPTTPSALLREAYWCAVMRKMDAIGAFSGHSLFTIKGKDEPWEKYRLSSYTRHTDPTAWPVVSNFYCNVATPLGPLLRAAEERPMEVAVLESAASTLFAGRGTWGWMGSLFNIGTALVGAGLSPHVLYEEDLLEKGVPKSVKVLVLSECDVLEEGTVKAIREWQTSVPDAITFADRYLVPAIVPDAYLPKLELTKDGEADIAAFRRFGNELKAMLAPMYRPYVEGPAKTVTHAREWGNSDFVFVVNDNRGYGDYVGPWKTVLDKGLPNKGAVRVRRKAGAVYDVLAHKLVKSWTKKEDGAVWTHFNVSFETNDGRLFMLVAEPLKPLKVDVHRTCCEVEVRVSSDNPDALIPIKVDVPGRQRPFYSVIKGGRWRRTFKAGNGKVIVTNLSDGSILQCDP